MVKKHKSGCCVCGKELVYGGKSKNMVCFYCGKTSSTNVACSNEHYVCDNCHASSANDIIGTVCISTSLTDPLELAVSIMNHPQVKMHGPRTSFSNTRSVIGIILQ